jgi:hypothetical protein
VNYAVSRSYAVLPRGQTPGLACNTDSHCLFQREKGSATRLCVPVHPVPILTNMAADMAAAELQGTLSGKENPMLHAIVYLESKFDLKTLSCRQTARLYRALYRAIEKFRVLIERIV